MPLSQQRGGGRSLMKFWAILQIIVDDFWGGRCGVCGGRGVFFYPFGGPHVQKVNLFFPKHVNVLQKFLTSVSLLPY